MAHTSSNVLLHFIFSTSGRRSLIKPEFRDDLFAYLGGIVREMRGVALGINGTCDHVHMLLRVRSVHSSAEIARVVKANSSRWVRENWCAEFGWQNRVRRVQRQRIERSRGYEIYCWTARTSQDAVISGGICSVSEEESRGVRRKLYLGLGAFLSPLPGLVGVGRLTHGLRRGLHSFAASRLPSGASRVRLLRYRFHLDSLRVPASANARLLCTVSIWNFGGGG